jgi:hypothetical protein
MGKKFVLVKSRITSGKFFASCQNICAGWLRVPTLFAIVARIVLMIA